MFKEIIVPRSLRYSLTPNAYEKGKILIIALHGYGQLVEFFSKKFELLGNDFVVVCPEGMHRFYLEGTSGRVGASWMTKEWRTKDIEENIEALNQLITQLNADLEPSKIIVLGFSQGVATAARWINNTPIKIDEFIAWAGVYPPDLPAGNDLKFNGKKTALVGNNDPYFKDEFLDKMIAQYQLEGFETRIFEGKHEIIPEILKQILST